MPAPLAQDPAERYQQAEEIVLDLEQFMYGEGYGPTNQKLAAYLHELFPEVDKDRLLPEEVLSGAYAPVEVTEVAGSGKL